MGQNSYILVFNTVFLDPVADSSCFYGLYGIEQDQGGHICHLNHVQWCRGPH